MRCYRLAALLQQLGQRVGVRRKELAQINEGLLAQLARTTPAAVTVDIPRPLIVLDEAREGAKAEEGGNASQHRPRR